MLGNSSKIRSYSTFKTAEQLFSRQKPWSEIPDEGERRLLFDEYVGGLKTVEEVRVGLVCKLARGIVSSHDKVWVSHRTHKRHYANAISQS